MFFFLLTPQKVSRKPWTEPKLSLFSISDCTTFTLECHVPKEGSWLFIPHFPFPHTHPSKTDYSIFRKQKCGCVNKENIIKLFFMDSHSQSLFIIFVHPFEKHHFSKITLLPGAGSLVKIEGITCKNIKNRFPLLNSRPGNITQLSSVISVITNVRIRLTPKYLYRKKKGKRSSRQTFYEPGREQMQKRPAKATMQGTASSLRGLIELLPFSTPVWAHHVIWASQRETKFQLQCSHHNREH